MKTVLEKLAEKKKKELDLLYFDKYSSLFYDAYSFLARRKALLYGGTALNEILPSELKIYDPYTLPDIDVLSPDAEKLASSMVKFYRKNKHEAVSFTEALHPGTYKVFADGVQIADITQCHQDTYNQLRQNCIYSKQWKIKIVPPQYLRMTLHKILSQPNDAHRWVNAYERLQKFYKVYPIKHCTISIKNKEKSTNEQQDSVRKVLSPYAVFIGARELQKVLPNKFTSIPLLVLTDQDLTEIKFLLKQQTKLTTSKIFPADDFVSTHFLVFDDKQLLAIVFRLTSCVSFHRIKKEQIGGLHTTMDLLISLTLSSYAHFKKVPFQCVADELSLIPSSSKRKILQPFVVTCYGPSIGLATMRRERVKRLRKKSPINF